MNDRINCSAPLLTTGCLTASPIPKKSNSLLTLPICRILCRLLHLFYCMNLTFFCVYFFFNWTCHLSPFFLAIHLFFRSSTPSPEAIKVLRFGDGYQYTTMPRRLLQTHHPLSPLLHPLDPNPSAPSQNPQPSPSLSSVPNPSFSLPKPLNFPSN